MFNRKYFYSTTMFKAANSLGRFLHTKTKVWCVSVRKKHVWTQGRFVKSPFDDVVVPNVCINEYIWRNLDKWPKKTAIVCAITNRSYTYEQLYKKTQAFGANLRQKLNIVDQDVVAIVLPNVPEYPIAAFGTIAAGGIATTFHPDFTAYELQRQLTSSEAKAIVTVPEKVPIIREALVLCKRDLPIICVDMDQATPEGTMSFKEAVEDCHVDLDILKQVKICPEDVSFLPYSSGTTGQPKGVQLTHRNLIANCEQQNTECRLHSHTTEQYQDSVMAMIPFFHSYGLSIIMVHKLSVGVRVVAVPKFEPERFLNVLSDYKISLLPMVPPIVKFLASYSQATPKHLEHVDLIMSGGAPLPIADIHGILGKVKSDVHFNQSYGLTETSPLATTIPKGYKDYTSVGLPLPNIELRVVNEQFNNLGPNEAGELLIRGPNVMKGYKNNPDANNEIFLEGGWLRTGDLATISETGVVNICDRLKELIKVKGHQVPPAELESVIRDHPAVSDTAVVGIPDPAKGEVPKAFVVLKEGVKANEKDIMNFVAERLIAYKRLKSVTFVDTIPKTPSGKILRRLFKD